MVEVCKLASALLTVILVCRSAIAAKDGLTCYTCLGRDWDNCKRGSVTCSGTCFKLVDDEHVLFAKGCAPDVSSETSKPDVTLDQVKLPWDNNKPVKGTAYYCKSDLCNAAHSAFQADKFVFIVFGILCSLGIYFRLD